MAEDMKEPSMIARLFCYAIDQNRSRLKESLHPDAILDWFGRCIRGSDEIITFLDTQFPSTQHYVFSAKQCDLMKHRTKSNFKEDDSPLDDDQPPSKVRKLSDNFEKTNLMNLLAGLEPVLHHELPKIQSTLPKCTPVGNVSNIEVPDLKKNRKKPNFKAIVMSANLYIYSKRNKMTPTVWERKLKHIVLEFDDRINLIVYEGVSNCRKNLSLQFDQMESK